MLTDTTVISAPAGRYQVLAQRFDVLFGEGANQTAIGLHQVLHDGKPRMFLRALRFGSCSLIVFDLRDVCKELDLDIRQSPARDTDGLIMFTLRKHFQTAAECSAKMMALPIDMLRDATVLEEKAA